MPTPICCINATHDHSALASICAAAHQAAQPIHILHRRADRAAILAALPMGHPRLCLIELPDTAPQLPPGLCPPETEVFFLPCAPGIPWPQLQQCPPLPHAHCLQPLVPSPPGVSAEHYMTGPMPWFGWRAPGPLAQRILREPSAWTDRGVELMESIQRWPDPPRWQSIPLHLPGSDRYPRSSTPRLTLSSRVLAVISFYQCEQWLHACLTSMVQQTHPPDNIVVIDDCSPQLPRAFLEPFPQVTLLSTTQNVGPEKILNNIIKSTDYDAYLVQDADDWSSHDRLELSLRTAAETGAALVGTHEFRIDVPRQALSLCIYPPDVNHAMSQQISHHSLHGTSLIARDLALQIGGFDERLKLGADVDFAARAWHVGRIVNLPAFCLFRRVREGSLTTAARTGYQSPERMLEDRFVTIRARRHLDAARAGQTPDVFVPQKHPITFVHHQGPRLRPAAPQP